MRVDRGAARRLIVEDTADLARPCERSIPGRSTSQKPDSSRQNSSQDAKDLAGSNRLSLQQACAASDGRAQIRFVVRALARFLHGPKAALRTSQTSTASSRRRLRERVKKRQAHDGESPSTTTAASCCCSRS